MSQDTPIPSISHTPSAKNFNAPAQRARRKIARDVWSAYHAVARAAGFFPIEIRTAEAVTLCHYEVAGQDYDKPRKIKLLLIGAVLSSYGKTDDGKINTASNRTSQLFTHAQPRTGYQLLTRYKAVEENKAHEYVDHLLPVAEIVAEEHDKLRQAILSDNQPRKQVRIAEARDQLAAKALVLLPPCDAELVDENGDVYAYLSDAEARAHAAKNPNFEAKPKTARRKKPLADADFQRLTKRIKDTIHEILDEAQERNGLPDANKYSLDAERAALKAFESWRKTAPACEIVQERECVEELIHVSEVGGQGADESSKTDVKNALAAEAVAPQLLGGAASVNPLDSNILENDFFETSEIGAVENLSGSINFDSALEAALFYARDGRPVLPICQWDPEKGRCTGEKHKADCGGRKPLVAREGGKPGDGYAGSTDLDQVRDWWRQFPDAGVGIRLDGHVLIDCDLKDGGPGSYEFLRDTFDLPPTLTAITQSGGRHYVFKLPEGLPDAWLKSWTRVGDKVALPGIDLKVGKCGLLFAEPTIGSKGVYRWLDPTVEPATLPRAVCDFLHEIRYKDEKIQAEKPRQASRVYSSSDEGPKPLDSNQAPYFKDVPVGDRHKRLLTVGTAIRVHTRAGADEIAAAMRQHAAAFSTPLHDEAWIVRTAASIAGRF